MSDREKLTELVAAFLGGLSVTDITPPYGHENLADYLLANGVVVRERGEWERYSDDKFSGYDADGKLKYRKVYIYECPRCGENTAAKRNFCPNCGADMRKGENDGW